LVEVKSLGKILNAALHVIQAEELKTKTDQKPADQR